MMQELVAQINSYGYGIVMRQVISSPVSVTYVTTKRETRYFKYPPHKNEGKWRVALSNGDGSTVNWSESVVTDTPEKGLEILLNQLRSKDERTR